MWPPSYYPMMANGMVPNQVPFHTPTFPVPGEPPVMPANYGNMIPNQQPFYVPVLPSHTGQSMIVPTRHGAREGYITNPDPSTIPELLQNGQGIIMTAQDTTAVSKEELTKILEANRHMNHEPNRPMNHEPVNSQQFPGARMNTTENFTLPRSTAGQPSGVQVIPLVAQGVVLTGGNHTVAFKFNSNVRNPPKGYCLWQATDPEGTLTEEMLAAADPQKRRELLGDRLYPLIYSMYSDMAAKITGMLLELDNARLLHMLEHVPCLRDKVDEAVELIRYQQAQETQELKPKMNKLIACCHMFNKLFKVVVIKTETEMFGNPVHNIF